MAEPGEYVSYPRPSLSPRRRPSVFEICAEVWWFLRSQWRFWLKVTALAFAATAFCFIVTQMLRSLFGLGTHLHEPKIVFSGFLWVLVEALGGLVYFIVNYPLYGGVDAAATRQVRTGELSQRDLVAAMPVFWRVVLLGFLCDSVVLLTVFLIAPYIPIQGRIGDQVIFGLAYLTMVPLFASQYFLVVYRMGIVRAVDMSLRVFFANFVSASLIFGTLSVASSLASLTYIGQAALWVPFSLATAFIVLRYMQMAPDAITSPELFERKV
jgi:hypothetical protein